MCTLRDQGRYYRQLVPLQAPPCTLNDDGACADILRIRLNLVSSIGIRCLSTAPWSLARVSLSVPHVGVGLNNETLSAGPDSAGTSAELSSIFPLTLSTCVHTLGSRSIPPLLPRQYCPTLGAAVLSRRSLLFSSSSMGSDVSALDPSQSIVTKSIPIS